MLSRGPPGVERDALAELSDVDEASTVRSRGQKIARRSWCPFVPGCRASRCLDIHHLIHQENGGQHVLSNLGLICFGHHMLHHNGKLEITGKPGKFTFRRVLDGGDRVEELGEYEVIGTSETSNDLSSVPRGTEDDPHEGTAPTE